MAASASAPILGGVGFPPVSTTVTFNGAYSPILFSDVGQINAIVPYDVAGQSNVSVVVTHYGQSSPFTVPVADTSPAIFTQDGTGSGQGAILNVDNTVNSARQPAAASSVIQIYATGAGIWNPPCAGDHAYQSVSSVSGSSGASFLDHRWNKCGIQYAGGAPTFLSGVLQVNAVVPAGLSPGPQPLVLKVGENSNAQQQVTVAVQ